MPIKAIGDDLFLVDLVYKDTPRVITTYVLRNASEAALIETGPATTLHTLLAALDTLDIPRAAVRHVLVTHIHLDHAGASGHLAELLPNALFFVHPVGLPHMADPTRLISSARRLYGDALDVLLGVPKPIPADRLVPLEDGQSLTLAGHPFLAYHTPGHARHHVVLWDPGRRVLFTGDVGGVRMPGVESVRPPTPPPDIDVEAWQESIRRIRGLRPSALALAHGDVYADVTFHLDDLAARLQRWATLVHDGLQAGKTPEAIEEDLRAEADPAVGAAAGGEVLTRFERAMSYRSSVAGLVRYWQKQGQL